MPTANTANAPMALEVENGIPVSPPTTTSFKSTSWRKRNRINKIRSFVALKLSVVALGLTLSRRDDEIDRSTIPSQIIGGSEAIPDRYSYMVSFQDSWGQHSCGGSLITKDIVLTAAHCLIDATTMAVVGRHDFNVDVGGESIPVSKAISHPTYNQAAAQGNDFMLVFLETEFTANNVGLIKLNSDDSIPCVNQDLMSMGWGDYDISICQQPLSQQLKQVDIKVTPNDECDGAEVFINGTSNILGPITDNMLCSTRAYEEDTCQGDSGGPLVIKGTDAASDVQVGVVSFGIGCALGSPGVYSRVSKAYDWIANEVCAYDSFKAEIAGFDCPLISTRTPTTSPSIPTPTTYAPTTVAPTPSSPRQCDEYTTCAEGMCCSAWGVSLPTFLSSS